MTLRSLLDNRQTDPETAPNLPVWRSAPPRPARTVPLPADLPVALAEGLRARGIDALYSHQAATWDLVRGGRHVVLATGTASGKTLAYSLPVLTGLLEDPSARALWLFPTKALAQDQLAALHTWKLPGLQAAIYDGDTPQSARSAIRKNARIVLSNPDMLHTGVLPHHANWADFLSGLRYVVIDEMHTYRGVFGSHVANVLRRLTRIARFHGADPRFVLASATIGNPGELGERLIEAPVALVDQDGSARGPRHFLIYNPPVTDAALGLRKSALMESVRLAQDLLRERVQSVVFARSRRSVEILLKYLQEVAPVPPSRSREGGGGVWAGVRGYRSGYLPSERRAIERGLRDGTVPMVVATNALELGIDIGGLGAALLVGYPGSIASTWQQAGRAGRGAEPALAVLVVTAAPLDQFLARHPDYFFARPPEQALIDPDHLVILLNHLRCASFELPFRQGEAFGRLDAARTLEFLDFLAGQGELHASQGKYFWNADAYPAAAVSLRSAAPGSVVLQAEQDGEVRAVGEVDLASAAWLAHPGAVYLHEGQSYFVEQLDLEKNIARLSPLQADYYTEPQRQSEVTLLERLDQDAVPGGRRACGELQVTTRVAGFKKLRWFTRETLGEEPLDLPPSEFQTTGYWLALEAGAVETLREAGLWRNDANDYGPGWGKLRTQVRARDGHRCTVCGTHESGRVHDVHHRVPFRAFTSAAEANRIENLVTLCPACHRAAEQNVRIRSGLAGLAYVLGQLAPLFLLCDSNDLGVSADPQAAFADGDPAVVLYDLVPAGIGLSQKLYELHAELAARALELVEQCPCADGCPSCVGPGGENGLGGKRAALELLRRLTP